MNQGDLGEKLTPAAQQALEELIDNYVKEIIMAASSSAADLAGKVEEITVRDIVNAAAEYKIRRQSYQVSRRKRFYNVMLLSGTTYSATGVGIFAYYAIEIGPTAWQQLSIALLTLGVVTSTMAYYLSRRMSFRERFQKEPSPQGLDRSLSLLRKWQGIELAIKRLVSDKLGESAADLPLKRSIDELKRVGVLSANDVSSILGLLSTRNDMVHQMKEMDINTLSKANIDADALLDLLVTKAS